MNDLPSHALAELGRIDLREHDIAAVLGRIAEVAKRTIPGTAEASVTLIEAGEARTAAYTGNIALALDERQYEEEHGPCLDAAVGSAQVTVTDMATDDRWKKFAEAAVAAGVHSSLSMGIPIQDAVVGALNMYGTTPAAFNDDSIELARTFAGYAAIALANAHLYTSSAALAQQMRHAMESRSVIDQAIGVTMVQERCNATQAFDLLVRLSQASNRKLREVAQMMIDAKTAEAEHG
ncbi:MAG TPA: GAF and ANTAR domain-containing protein [Acidothermaceae bacterium]|jgi:GAF domain-containing protein